MLFATIDFKNAVIADEAQHIKNRRCQNAPPCTALARAASASS